MTSPVISRRLLLAAGASISFLGGGAFADETLNRRKIVVVICRGGMDGLSVSPPVGDSTRAVSIEPSGGTSRSMRSMCQEKVPRV